MAGSQAAGSGVSIVGQPRAARASSSTSTSSSTTCTPRSAPFGVERRLPALRVILPVGISFYTFQALTYTIDVYRGRCAGAAQLPRLRGLRLLLPAAGRRPDRAGDPPAAAGRAATGRSRLAAARDATVAHRVGLLQEAGHRRQRRRHRQQGLRAERPGVLRALGRGVRLRDPDLRRLLRLYRHRARRRAVARVRADASTSTIRTWRAGPADFWRRWHISLSTWFRDYVYIPLGGSRRGTAARRAT